MIFVTVGTHEQQFNRLVKQVDLLKKEGLIKDSVFIQTGFSTYIPQSCEYSSMLSYEQMISYVKQSSIVITHGGPSSFILPLQYGKIPIVVPRQKCYDEHVNDHQLSFVKQYYLKAKNIIPIYDISELNGAINQYANLKEKCAMLKSNNLIFTERFVSLVNELFE